MGSVLETNENKLQAHIWHDKYAKMICGLDSIFVD